MFSQSKVEKFFFTNNPVAIIAIDPETGDIIDANEAAIAFYGFEKEVFTTLNISQINNASSEVINSNLIEHRLASGIIKSVEVTSTPIIIEDKTIIYSMINEMRSNHSITNRIDKSNHEFIDVMKIKNDDLHKELLLNKTLIENLDQGVVFFDALGNIMLYNASFLKIYAYAQGVNGDLHGKIDLERFSTFIKAHIYQDVFKTDFSNDLLTNQFKDLPITLRINNEIRHFLFSASEIIGVNDRHYGRLFVIKDITAYKTAEKLKKTVEDRYERIFTNTPVGIISFDAEGIIEESNETFQEMLGSTKEKLRGLDLKSLKNTSVTAAISKCLAGEIAHYEGWYSAVTGDKTVYITITFTPFFDEHTGVIGGLGVINDVTSIKNSEKIMENQKVKFEALFKNSPIATIQFDENHRGVRINSAFTKLFGYTQDEAKGRELDGLLSNQDTLAEMIVYTREIFRGESVETEGIRTSKNGDQIKVDIVGIPIIIEGKVKGGYSLYSDIRKEEQIKNELTIAKEKAEEANQIKTQFLANMSHEIRTPMNGFVGILKLLEETELDDLQKYYLYLANKSASSLIKLVTDVLDYSKIESNQTHLEVSKFRLHHLLSDIISLYRPLAFQKKLSFYYEIEDDLHDFWEGDAFRIKQVLSNLLSNAIKYTDEGKITLKVSLLSLDQSEQGHFLFAVEDTGIGVPENKRNLLFKRFSQVHDKNVKYYGGTGLGLAIVKGIAELMHGDITYEPVKPIGSQFKFTCKLKQIEGIVEPECEYVKPITSEVSQMKKILVVDDDETSRFVLAKIASVKGYDVYIAEDGYEAINQCASTKFDVILMDCQMPKMNGFEATNKIRKLWGINAKTPIYALTALSQAEDVERCIAAGMTHYFSKPIDYEMLFKHVQSL